MAGRQLRHEFLARTARAGRIPIVALAHHGDDQVELFFLRLLRGSGLTGLTGMKWRSPSPVAAGLNLVRPLLGVAKADLLAYARAHQLPFHEDHTNADLDILRNRIRHELLPLLRREYQPAVDRTVLRAMEILSGEAACVGAWAEALHAGTKPPFASLAAADFSAWPVALQRRVLQSRLTALGVSPDFDLIEQLREYPGRPVSVNPRQAVVCSAAGEVSLRAPATPAFATAEKSMVLRGRRGHVAFGGQKIQWQRTVWPTAPAAGAKDISARLRVKPAGEEWFDAETIGRQVVLRYWRPGDRFQPIGLRQRAKLQDLFVNAKIPAARRRSLLVAATATGELFWVEGLRIGEIFKITAQTRRRLVWQVFPPALA